MGGQSHISYFSINNKYSGGFGDLLGFVEETDVQKEESEQESTPKIKSKKTKKLESCFTLFTKREVKKSWKDLNKLFSNKSSESYSTKNYADIIDRKGRVSAKYKNEFELKLDYEGKCLSHSII